MTDPIVFIIRHQILEGMGDDFVKHYQNRVQPTLEDKPDTVVQLAYINQENAEVVIVRLFPDAEALDHQIQGAEERTKVTYQFIEPTEIEIFGTPNQSTLEKMNEIAGLGIEIKIHPEYIGGFVRT
jgi:hypothetical protein